MISCVHRPLEAMTFYELFEFNPFTMMLVKTFFHYHRFTIINQETNIDSNCMLSSNGDSGRSVLSRGFEELSVIQV